MRHHLFNLTVDNINGIEIQANHVWFFRCYKWCKKQTFCIKTRSTVNVNKCITRHIVRQFVKFTHWIEIQTNNFFVLKWFFWMVLWKQLLGWWIINETTQISRFFKPVWKLIWQKKKKSDNANKRKVSQMNWTDESIKLISTVARTRQQTHFSNRVFWAAYFKEKNQLLLWLLLQTKDFFCICINLHTFNAL